MNVISSASAFESFNARNLSPRQVAQTFIPPAHFDDLILRRHSLVIGPRGSGKTTLLKMLQLPALAAWKHPAADRYRSRVDFTGVFVPTDVSWGAQIEALGHRDLPRQLATALGSAAFTTHVLIALVDAMRDCSSVEVGETPSLAGQFVQLSRAKEASLVACVATSWRLKPAINNLQGLKLSLRTRLIEIAEIARRETGEGDRALERLRLHEYLHLGFLESTSAAIDVFNDIISQPERRWGLLFDELEIAPKDIRQILLKSLRSSDQRLIFKLSISPYHEDVHLLQEPTSAMPGHDYQAIELWYPRKEEGYEFSEDLLHSMIREYDCQDATPEEIFGPSEFDPSERERQSSQSSYAPGGKAYERFKRLAQRDTTFMDYLTSNRINLDAMDKLSETRRAGIIRKVASIVAVREAYRFSASSDKSDNSAKTSSADTRGERSRKNPLLYAGAKSLFAIVEGNPRWFIGLVGPMLRSYAEKRQRVPAPEQAESITSASNRFRALLRTIPYTAPGGQYRTRAHASRGLLGLLDEIGAQFHRNVVTADFSAEPALSFIVDSSSPDDLLHALGRALNAGAIILAPDGGETLLSSLRGKRFRLSYMLAPAYGIPLTLGRPVALSQILTRSGEAPSLLNWLPS